MFQTMQDNEPTEDFKIQVAPALCTSFLIIPYLILKELQNYEPIIYEKIISSKKKISKYIGDNSHALEYGIHRFVSVKIEKYILQNAIKNYTID